jgi:hypothetical protein
MIGKVRYVDYEQPEETEGTPLVLPFLKRRSFEHEHEVRLVYCEHPAHDGILDCSAAKDSYDFRVDLAVLIEVIFISPHSPAWLKAPVEELLKRFGVKGVTVQRSDLYDRTVK